MTSWHSGRDSRDDDYEKALYESRSQELEANTKMLISLCMEIDKQNNWENFDSSTRTWWKEEKQRLTNSAKSKLSENEKALLNIK